MSDTFVRLDKRKPNELRKLVLKRGVSRYAEGSCLVTIGHTQVLCTASVEEKVPFFVNEKQSGWLTAEYGMLPRSCKERVTRDVNKGRAGGRTYEIQRLIGRSLRAVLEMRDLGERTIWIDCDVIEADGGTRCASITGSFIALYDACAKLLKGKLIKQMPIKDYVAAVSMGVVRGRPVMDLTYEEDSRADVDMNIVLTGDGRMVEIQGTAEKEPFSDAALKNLISMAKKGLGEIFIAQKKLVQL